MESGHLREKLARALSRTSVQKFKMRRPIFLVFEAMSSIFRLLVLLIVASQLSFSSSCNVTGEHHSAWPVLIFSANPLGVAAAVRGLGEWKSEEYKGEHHGYVRSSLRFLCPWKFRSQQKIVGRYFCSDRIPQLSGTRKL
jgi:hypothetical protein